MRKLATDRAGLEILHLGDCFLLLKSVPLGRIGFIAGGEVVILPVNFLVDGQDVVFRTAAGSKLSAVEVGHYVGFEADSYDAASGNRLVGGRQRARRDRRGGRRGGPPRRARAGLMGRRPRRPGVGADPAVVDHRAAHPTPPGETDRQDRLCRARALTAGSWVAR